jgi:hypothetical protein
MPFIYQDTEGPVVWVFNKDWERDDPSFVPGRTRPQVGAILPLSQLF